MSKTTPEAIRGANEADEQRLEAQRREEQLGKNTSQPEKTIEKEIEQKIITLICLKMIASMNTSKTIEFQEHRQ